VRSRPFPLRRNPRRRLRHRAGQQSAHGRRILGDDQRRREERASSPGAACGCDAGNGNVPCPAQLAYRTCLASGAEAVICIANKPVTWHVVHCLEPLGILAFGPIWDS